MKTSRLGVTLLFALLSGGAIVHGQLLATDDFEGYTNSPVGQFGGAGDWTGAWGASSQYSSPALLNTNSKIDATKSLGLFGNGNTTGTSVSRPFPACTNEITISASIRGDFNANGTGAPVPRRFSFTIRAGNELSHFGNQRLSFFFPAGTTNFLWYDGVDHTNSTVNFTLGHVYDLRTTLNPINRAYSFSISNRNNGTTFNYSGNWLLGSNGEAIGSVAFFIRGPTGDGNNAYLDSVAVSSPSYTPPPPQTLPILEKSLWRYFKGTSTPAAQGTNEWYGVHYDTSSWLGPAPSGFGYGDSDDATTLSDMVNNYLSVFTRNTFVVNDTSTITHLTLAADYDDGFVAYLNGVEVARRNMPAGPVDHATAAVISIEPSRSGQDNYTCNCEPVDKEYITINAGALVIGTNVLAVSGHNVSLGSSDLSLIIEIYTNITLIRGPILQMPNPGKITMLWRTAALADSAIDYGFDTNYTGGTISNATLMRNHEMELPAFAPGTTVYYRIRGDGEILAANHFRSPKEAGQSFRFAIMSDYGSATPNTRAVAQQVLLKDPDLLVTCGDNVQMNSAPPGLFDSDWFGPLSGLTARMPMMSALGNHDIRIAQGAWYLDAVTLPTYGPAGLTERNYSFDYGNAHFVVLDANAFVPDADTTYTNPAAMRLAITSWLTNDLHTTTQLWKFAFYHHPPYTSQGSHGDGAVMKANLSPILEQYGVDIAFQGHNHMYERINPINGVHYFTVGSGGFSIHGLSNQREFSAKVFNEKYDFVLIDIDGPHLMLRCIDQDGVERDSYDLDLSLPFKMDGLIDSTNWVRSANGMTINAAIRGPYLYLATQDAGEGNDHFIYINSTSAPLQAANWAKSGNIMQWSAFLADENGGGGAVPGFYSWYNSNQTMLTNPSVYRAVTSGLNNNSTNGNGVLEGTMQLFSHFGSFPTQLLIAAAPYTTLDAGTLVSEAQVPAGNGNGDIEESEFLAIATRDLALDLPVANAGSNISTEAGMWINLDGSLSSAASGLPLSHTWSPLSGEPGEIINAGSALASFRLTNQIGATTSTVLQLVVFDTRFDSSDLAEITFTVMIDSDQDGLSDQEELTGLDNLFTVANPRGNITDPNFSDTDDDGAPDGQEALAGTDPNDPDSVFKITSSFVTAGNELLVRWASVSGKLYSINYTTNLFSGLISLYSNLPATEPLNSFTVTVDGVEHTFYGIEVQP